MLLSVILAISYPWTPASAYCALPPHPIAGLDKARGGSDEQAVLTVKTGADAREVMLAVSRAVVGLDKRVDPRLVYNGSTSVDIADLNGLQHQFLDIIVSDSALGRHIPSELLMALGKPADEAMHATTAFGEGYAPGMVTIPTTRATRERLAHLFFPLEGINDEGAAEEVKNETSHERMMAGAGDGMVDAAPYQPTGVPPPVPLPDALTIPDTGFKMPAMPQATPRAPLYMSEVALEVYKNAYEPADADDEVELDPLVDSLRDGRTLKEVKTLAEMYGLTLDYTPAVGTSHQAGGEAAKIAAGLLAGSMMEAYAAHLDAVKEAEQEQQGFYQQLQNLDALGDKLKEVSAELGSYSAKVNETIEALSKGGTSRKFEAYVALSSRMVIGAKMAMESDAVMRRWRTQANLECVGDERYEGGLVEVAEMPPMFQVLVADIIRQMLVVEEVLDSVKFEGAVIQSAVQVCLREAANNHEVGFFAKLTGMVPWPLLKMMAIVQACSGTAVSKTEEMARGDINATPEEYLGFTDITELLGQIHDYFHTCTQQGFQPNLREVINTVMELMRGYRNMPGLSSAFRDKMDDFQGLLRTHTNAMAEPYRDVKGAKLRDGMIKAFSDEAMFITAEISKQAATEAGANEDGGASGGVFAVKKAAKSANAKKQRGGTNGPAGVGNEPDGLKPTSELEKRKLHVYPTGPGDAATIEQALRCLPCTNTYPPPNSNATFMGKICLNVCFDGSKVDGVVVPCARAQNGTCAFELHPYSKDDPCLSGHSGAIENLVTFINGLKGHAKKLNAAATAALGIDYGMLNDKFQRMNPKLPNRGDERVEPTKKKKDGGGGGGGKDGGGKDGSGGGSPTKKKVAMSRDVMLTMIKTHYGEDMVATVTPYDDAQLAEQFAAMEEARKAN